MDGLGLFSLSITFSISYTLYIRTKLHHTTSISNIDHDKANISLSNHEKLVNVIQKLESLIQQDEGHRGIQSLCIQGELYRITEALYNPDIKNITIITGFPCFINKDPPTETDGPLGALTIARALLALPNNTNTHHGKNIKIITDECNEEVILMAVSASGIYEQYNGTNSRNEIKRITLESFPNQYIFDISDAERLKHIADWSDAVIAIERPGPNQYGEYLSMNKTKMCHLIAPLEDIIGYRLNTDGNIIQQLLQQQTDNNLCNSNNNNNNNNNINTTDNWFDEELVSTTINSSSLNTNESAQQPSITSTVKPFLSIGIGDGGNEVGMGKVYHKIISESTIPNKEEIACIVPTTFTLAASVSNWGGYSIAAALACYHFYKEYMQNENNNDHDKNKQNNEKMCKYTSLNDALNDTNPDISIMNKIDILSNIMTEFLSTEVLETEICSKMVLCGARDGVTGKQEVSVDGLPWTTHVNLFYQLKVIAFDILF